MKRYSTGKSLGKYKLKLQWNTTTYLLMIKLERLAILSAGENMEWLTLIYLQWECNDTTSLENALAVLLKVKHRFTCDVGIPLLGIYPKEMKAYVHTKTCTENT